MADKTLIVSTPRGVETESDFLKRVMEFLAPDPWKATPLPKIGSIVYPRGTHIPHLYDPLLKTELNPVQIPPKLRNHGISGQHVPICGYPVNSLSILTARFPGDRSEEAAALAPQEEPKKVLPPSGLLKGLMKRI